MQYKKKMITKIGTTNFVLCMTAVVEEVVCGIICELLSDDSSSNGRLIFDDTPVIAYASAPFETLFARLFLTGCFCFLVREI